MKISDIDFIKSRIETAIKEREKLLENNLNGSEYFDTIHDIFTLANILALLNQIKTKGYER